MLCLNGLVVFPAFFNLSLNFAILFRLEKKLEGKRLSEEALKIAEKRRETKGKDEKEKYTHLNSEFQRTAKKF